MLFSYEKKELSAAEIWDSLLVPTQRKGGWAGPVKYCPGLAAWVRV